MVKEVHYPDSIEPFLQKINYHKSNIVNKHTIVYKDKQLKNIKLSEQVFYKHNKPNLYCRHYYSSKGVLDSAIVKNRVGEELAKSINIFHQNNFEIIHYKKHKEKRKIQGTFTYY
ncbi:MAG: hypothetical protein JSU07_10525 [Bacteroidetes bacterium]|nr:hypothetical protein [Bacteroidota bacterium]